jgi:hypothetical protein
MLHVVLLSFPVLYVWLVLYMFSGEENIYIVTLGVITFRERERERERESLLKAHACDDVETVRSCSS